MSKKIKPENLADEILKTLIEYEEDIEDVVKKETDSMIKEAKQELKAVSPKNTGAYASSWTIGTRKQGPHKYSRVVHNKDHYRLTHLLEFGHMTRDGTSRTKAQPHIRPTEEKFKQKLLIGISKEIKRG